MRRSIENVFQRFIGRAHKKRRGKDKRRFFGSRTIARITKLRSLQCRYKSIDDEFGQFLILKIDIKANGADFNFLEVIHNIFGKSKEFECAHFFINEDYGGTL